MKKITVDYMPAVSYRVDLLVEDEQAEDFNPYDPDWREEIENRIDEGDCRYYDVGDTQIDVAGVEDVPDPDRSEPGMQAHAAGPDAAPGI